MTAAHTGDEIIVRMRHVRAAGLCGPGMLLWFGRFDRALVRRFCREGLPIAEVDAFGDGLSQQVAAAARAESTAMTYTRQEIEHGR